MTAAGRWRLPDRDPFLLETSVPGIFACGDVRFSPVKRVAAAVGEGSMAIAFVHQYLKAAETAWLPEEIALDSKGYVLTGTDVKSAGRWGLDERDPYLLETSVPGIFAVGDVRYSTVKRVAAAVGEGSMAIAFVHQYLKAAETAIA